MQETRVRSLGWEEPLEKEMATHSSISCLEISMDRSLVGLQSMGSQKVRHYRARTHKLREGAHIPLEIHNLQAA